MFDKHETLILIGALIICAFFFVTGYYCGKRTVAQEYGSLIHQQTLDEKIQGALCSIGRAPVGKGDDQADSGKDTRDQEDETDAGASESSDEAEAKDHSTKDRTITGTTEKTVDKHIKQQHAYAQLVGFGSQSMANRYKDKLIREGFAVRVTDHMAHSGGRRSRGRHWYQVVTQAMPLKQLQKMVEEISKKDRLKDCKIVMV